MLSKAWQRIASTSKVRFPVDLCFYTYGDRSFKSGVQSFANRCSAVSTFTSWTPVGGGTAAAIEHRDGYNGIMLTKQWGRDCLRHGLPLRLYTGFGGHHVRR